MIAVEPVAEMRAALPSGPRALDGTAEAIPLADGTVDAVTVAQAFHWFDGDAALPEIHACCARVGVLALLWNRRVEDDAGQPRASMRCSRPTAPTCRPTAATRWRAAFERTSLFGPLERAACSTTPQELDADGLEARMGSISFIAALEPAERARVLARVRALAGDGVVDVAVPDRGAGGAAAVTVRLVGGGELHDRDLPVRWRACGTGSTRDRSRSRAA